MENKLLSILIPTYNRSKDLIYNINLLEKYILKNGLIKKINIIISDNNSTDNTKEELKALKIKSKLDLLIYSQEKNIGLEKNALYVLEKSTSDFVMYLGDDDYINEEYLLKVVEALKKEELSLIIPSIVAILPNKKKLGGGRDLNLKTKLYKKGFKNCLENSWRGHQLSGVTFKRIGVLESYKKNNVQNIYPFIYFTAYSCLKGEALHLTNFPVQVTQPGQEKKDWGYKNDGLISEIFDNYSKLDFINKKQRHLLEMKILSIQSWRYFMYKYKFPFAMLRIIFHSNTSLLTKFRFPLLVVTLLSKKVKKKLI